MKLRMTQPGVFVTDDPIVRVTPDVVNYLKQQVKLSPCGRVRLCVHRDSADAVHEMIIVLSRATYVHPHRHIQKSESFHAIEGSADIVLFTEQGTICRVVHMAAAAQDAVFYYRIDQPIYHTVLVQSDIVVIHETTKGPFVPGTADLAPWAPRETDSDAARVYIDDLKKRMRETLSLPQSASHPEQAQ